MDAKGFFSAVRETALTTGMIFMILIGAGIFNYFIDSTGLTDGLIRAVKDAGFSPWMVMFRLRSPTSARWSTGTPLAVSTWP